MLNINLLSTSNCSFFVHLVSIWMTINFRYKSIFFLPLSLSLNSILALSLPLTSILSYFIYTWNCSAGFESLPNKIITIIRKTLIFCHVNLIEWNCIASCFDNLDFSLSVVVIQHNKVLLANTVVVFGLRKRNDLTEN